MDCHGAVVEAEEFGNGEKVGLDVLDVGWGMERHGQASPRETSLRTVRDVGQIGPNPSINTFQRVGTETIGIEDAWVEGWDSK
jgi:hypothetical protein